MLQNLSNVNAKKRWSKRYLVEHYCLDESSSWPDWSK